MGDTMDRRFWKTRVAPRNVFFTLLVLGSIAISWRTLLAVFSAAFYNEQYSHILLILPVSVALLYGEHSRVFGDVEYSFSAGFFLLPVGMALVWAVRHATFLSSNDVLSLRMLLLVSLLVAAFIFCFGIQALRAAAFPLLFLFLLVPIPDLVLEWFVWLLQRCSTDLTCLMLKVANIPVLKTDFVLSLPGIDIEVARECSGIRSSLILLIVSLVLGHFFLRPGWRQIVLGLLVFPITVVKNSLRIFTLSILGVYVSPSFLNGNLHRRGGILFFSLALGLVILVVWWLKKPEKKMPATNEHFPGSGAVRPL
jgi:exosortase